MTRGPKPTNSSDNLLITFMYQVEEPKSTNKEKTSLNKVFNKVQIPCKENLVYLTIYLSAHIQTNHSV